MLELKNVNVFYEKAQALHNISLRIEESNVLALVGRNGAGKSTTLKALMGVLPIKKGERILNGENINNHSMSQISRAGVALVPDNRQIFPGLSCEENLIVASMSHKPGYWDTKKIYNLFPNLEKHAKANGTSLSGGEQQMLAIARALMTNPKYLLLDEPTEGLAPIIVQQIVEAIRIISKNGTGIILVEQNFQIPLKLANDYILIDGGQITWQGKKDEISDSLQEQLSGISIK